MGFFDVCCAATGIPLAGKTRLVPVAETASGSNRWAPIGLPICDTYNRIGYIDLPDKLDSNAKAIEAFCKTLTWDGDVDEIDLDAALSDLGRGLSEGTWAKSNGRRVSYALFDDGVYLALAKLGAKRTKLTLKSPDLFERVLPIDDLRAQIYGGMRAASLDTLRPRALELARVLAFPTKIAPIDVSVGDQLTGFSKKLNKYGPAEPYIAKAKKKWARHREVLAAIAKNERHWRELDEDRA